ncbi:hypothetical protein M0R89_09005 [Halorussus limi]|uniref:Uncharacterized protein n=1 Tax=Halorussus limi TaxID=2938695 RepID=A0A8U0HYE1_9EURY|nr:hypothetical protein [Halorussus limi]UPV76175.1 hypothetical protein M0R89_09005 [Halorussus limi]
MSEVDKSTEESDSFLHEELIPVLVVLGVLLVFIPDPITTTLGILLVGLGVGLWIWDLVE